MHNQNGRRPVATDVYVGVVLLVIGVAVLLYSLSFPAIPRRFAVIASALFSIFAICIMVNGLKKKGGKTGVYAWKEVKYALAVFAMTTGYVLLMDMIGFFVATIIFVPIMMLFLRVRSIPAILLCTIGINVFVYVLFVMQLRTKLP